nr:MAG TPA: hypothetical protein [Caudoviricetes sp.]
MTRPRAAWPRCCGRPSSTTIPGPGRRWKSSPRRSGALICWLRTTA